MEAATSDEVVQFEENQNRITDLYFTKNRLDPIVKNFEKEFEKLKSYAKDDGCEKENTKVYQKTLEQIREMKLCIPGDVGPFQVYIKNYVENLKKFSKRQIQGKPEVFERSMKRLEKLIEKRSPAVEKKVYRYDPIDLKGPIIALEIVEEHTKIREKGFTVAFQMKTGECVFPNELKDVQRLEGSSLVFTPDNQGVMYARVPLDSYLPSPDTYYSVIYYHKLGTRQEEDKPVIFYRKDKNRYPISLNSGLSESGNYIRTPEMTFLYIELLNTSTMSINFRVYDFKKLIDSNLLESNPPEKDDYFIKFKSSAALKPITNIEKSFLYLTYYKAPQ